MDEELLVVVLIGLIPLTCFGGLIVTILGAIHTTIIHFQEKQTDPSANLIVFALPKSARLAGPDK